MHAVGMNEVRGSGRQAAGTGQQTERTKEDHPTLEPGAAAAAGDAVEAAGQNGLGQAVHSPMMHRSLPGSGRQARMNFATLKLNKSPKWSQGPAHRVSSKGEDRRRGQARTGQAAAGDKEYYIVML